MSQPPPPQQSTQLPKVGRVLPGPAGKLQELEAAGALQQATPEVLGLKHNSASGGLSSSQAAGVHRDAAFQSGSWAAATAAAAEDEALAGPVRSIKSTKDMAVGKVPRMLVLLSTFSPSGAGSAFARIKDPSGTMGAAIHSSALQRQQQQQPPLGPGCVVLLQQVSVLTPNPGSCYLAVTADNIVQVWPAADQHERSIRHTTHQPAATQQHQQRQQQTQGQPLTQQQQHQPSQQQYQQRPTQWPPTQQQQHQQQSQPGQLRKGQQAASGADSRQSPSAFFPPPSPDIMSVLNQINGSKAAAAAAAGAGGAAGSGGSGSRYGLQASQPGNMQRLQQQQTQAQAQHNTQRMSQQQQTQQPRGSWQQQQRGEQQHESSPALGGAQQQQHGLLGSMAPPPPRAPGNVAAGPGPLYGSQYHQQQQRPGSQRAAAQPPGPSLTQQQQRYQSQQQQYQSQQQQFQSQQQQYQSQQQQQQFQCQQYQSQQQQPPGGFVLFQGLSQPHLVPGTQGRVAGSQGAPSLLAAGPRGPPGAAGWLAGSSGSGTQGAAAGAGAGVGDGDADVEVDENIVAAIFGSQVPKPVVGSTPAQHVASQQQQQQQGAQGQTGAVRGILVQHPSLAAACSKAGACSSSSQQPGKAAPGGAMGASGGGGGALGRGTLTPLYTSQQQQFVAGHGGGSQVLRGGVTGHAGAALPVAGSLLGKRPAAPLSLLDDLVSDDLDGL